MLKEQIKQILNTISSKDGDVLPRTSYPSTETFIRVDIATGLPVGKNNVTYVAPSGNILWDLVFDRDTSFTQRFFKS